ncbi:hypothetical protein E8E13_000422 [Curvularia kusanoi]|uniref:Uncharacterized protein n=1 Tax=Curvularia kusanoi TaxID=90978 RepID=A0A9P4T588_CURKU|nr:hypothetical protein E8E13_000422 [Curvularia kusanoi]
MAFADAEVGKEEVAEADSTAGNIHHHRSRKHRKQKPVSIHSPLLVAATYGLLVSLAIVAVCSVLAQFYGVLGLVQSQPDNGSWASVPLGALAAVQDQQTGELSHAPWVQGEALTVYASLGWLFSALAAGSIGASWLGRL